MLTSTPHKDEGEHTLTGHRDPVTHHRGRHKHPNTARHGWELADIESHMEEARRPDQISKERQR